MKLRGSSSAKTKVVGRLLKRVGFGQGRQEATIGLVQVLIGGTPSAYSKEAVL